MSPGGVPAAAKAPPGVTHHDVVCRPHAADFEDVEEFEAMVLGLLEAWAEDRALRADARARLVDVVRAAVLHGLQYEPRGLTILIRWWDLDRVRVDLRWWKSSATSNRRTARQDVDVTLSTLDALATDWGVDRPGRGWVHWLVVETG